MLEWPLVLMAGFLGSSHCIGMCGPLAIALGARSHDWKHNTARQASYSAGRIFTYSVLGAVAAAIGLSAANRFSSLAPVQALLAIVAGVFLAFQGLKSAGVLRGKAVVGAGAGCLLPAALRTLLSGRTAGHAFVAGMGTGMLPCGLVYGMLALAASTANVGLGMGTMFLFGLGTVPAMAATGLSGSLVSATLRRRILHVAAWLVVMAGAVSVVRGAMFLRTPAGAGPLPCPFCRSQ